MKVIITVTPNPDVAYEVPDWLFRHVADDYLNRLRYFARELDEEIEEITVTVTSEG